MIWSGNNYNLPTTAGKMIYQGGGGLNGGVLASAQNLARREIAGRNNFRKGIYMKKQHSHYVCVICTLLLFISCSQNVVGRETDPFPEIDMPIVPNAYNVYKTNNKPIFTKSVNYNLRVSYPATDVITFYNNKFTKGEWTLIGGMKGEESHWETFVDGTRKGSPQVRQYLALWRDSANKKEIILALKYQKAQDENWNDELWIGCQIHMVIDPRELQEFFGRIEASGEYRELMELVAKYRMSDGETDFQKAVKENPENKLLLEYRKLSEKMSKELEKAHSAE